MLSRIAVPGILLICTGLGTLLLFGDWRGISSWPNRQIITFECFLMAVLLVSPLMVRLLSRQALDPLEPGVLITLLFGIVYCLRPLLLESSWVAYLEQSRYEVFRFLSVSEADYVVAMGYGLIGALCFTLGYRTWSNPLAVPAKPRPPVSWSSRRVTRVAGIGVMWAVVSFILILPALGQVDSLVDEFGRYRALLLGYGYHGLGLDLMGVVVLFLWVDHLRGTPRRAAVVLLVISNVYNAFLGARSGIFNLWLILFLAHRYLKDTHSRWSGRRIIAAALVVVLAVFSALSLSAIRNEGLKNWTEVGTTVHDYWVNAPAELTLTNLLGEFDQFDIFSMIISMGPGEFPFMYGRSFLELGYQAVPRAWWPEKPWPFEVHVGRLLTGERTGIPPGIVGELYINFHVAGIIAGMWLLGWACRKGYQWGLAEPRDPCRVLVYALVLPYAPMIMLRSFVPIASMLLIAAVPAFVAARYIRGGRGSPSGVPLPAFATSGAAAGPAPLPAASLLPQSRVPRGSLR